MRCKNGNKVEKEKHDRKTCQKSERERERESTHSREVQNEARRRENKRRGRGGRRYEMTKNEGEVEGKVN